MSRFNQVQLIGHVGQAPKNVGKDANNPMTVFNMATNENYKDAQGQKVEKTEWHTVVCFSGLAKIVAASVGKGDFVLVNGKLQTRNYEIKEGAKVYVTEIIGESITFLKSNNPK